MEGKAPARLRLMHLVKNGYPPGVPVRVPAQNQSEEFDVLFGRANKDVNGLRRFPPVFRFSPHPWGKYRTIRMYEGYSPLRWRHRPRVYPHSSTPTLWRRQHGQLGYRLGQVNRHPRGHHDRWRISVRSRIFVHVCKYPRPTESGTPQSDTSHLCKSGPRFFLRPSFIFGLKELTDFGG